MRHVAIATLAALAVVLVVTGGTAWSDPSAPTGTRADKAHAKPLVVPAVERNRRNPYAGRESSIRNGAKLYSSQCAICHGISGDGKGELAVRHGFQTPDFTDPAWQAGRTDGECFYILTHGCRRMTGQEDRLNAEWRWDLVNYVRTLRKQGS